MWLKTNKNHLLTLHKFHCLPFCSHTPEIWPLKTNSQARTYQIMQINPGTNIKSVSLFPSAGDGLQGSPAHAAARCFCGLQTSLPLWFCPPSTWHRISPSPAVSQVTEMDHYSEINKLEKKDFTPKQTYYNIFCSRRLTLETTVSSHNVSKR